LARSIFFIGMKSWTRFCLFRQSSSSKSPPEAEEERILFDPAYK
jgi:hypothetical protein